MNFWGLILALSTYILLAIHFCVPDENKIRTKIFTQVSQTVYVSTCSFLFTNIIVFLVLLRDNFGYYSIGTNIILPLFIFSPLYWEWIIVPGWSIFWNLGLFFGYAFINYSYVVNQKKNVYECLAWDDLKSGI